MRDVFALLLLQWTNVERIDLWLCHLHHQRLRLHKFPQLRVDQCARFPCMLSLCVTYT